MKVVIIGNESTILKIMSSDDSIAVKIAKVQEAHKELNHLFKKIELLNEENVIKFDSIPERISDDITPESVNFQKKKPFCKLCNNHGFDRNGKPCRRCR